MATLLKEREAPGETVITEPLTVARWLAETALRWRLIAKVLGLTILLGAVAAIVIPPVYRSRVSFVANAAGGAKLPSSLASGPFAGLASQLGVVTGADPSESPNFYIELIQSRELLTRLLLTKFRDPRGASARDSASLLSILRPRGSDPQERLERALKKVTKAISGNYDNSTNLVWLDVDTRWPHLSAAVANKTTDLVSKFNNQQRVTRVHAKRVFLEGRLERARESLNAAEQQLRQFQEQNRSWRQSPSLVLDEQHLEREVTRTTTLYTQLDNQLETTLLEEVNDAPRITVVDSAVAASRPEWPKFGVLLATTLLTGLFLGFLVAGAAAVLANWKAQNPDSSGYLTTSLRAVRGELRNPLRRAAARKLNG